MNDDDKTTYNNYCNGRDCPEIKRLKKQVDRIYTRLDVIIGGIITVLITIIGGLLA